MYTRILFGSLLVAAQFIAAAQPAAPLKPLEKITLVADHIIASNPFRYELKPAPKKGSLAELNSIDFGRTLGTHQPAVAYALTWLDSPEGVQKTFHLEHSGAIKIFLNDRLVYTSDGGSEAHIEIEERSLKLSHTEVLHLIKGRNKLLIKSETGGSNSKWVVHLLADTSDVPISDSLEGIPGLTPELAELSDWLVIGPFENPVSGGERTGIDTVYPPEEGFETGKLYEGIHGPVTWSLPRMELLADARPIDPIWGSYLNFNYHTAGVAWAMMHLAEATGERRFDDYARRYTDFMIETKPFVRYQMEELNEYYSVNYHMNDVPLLDFTLAPALPFIYRLISEEQFSNRSDYEQWVADITRYALEEQVRLNGTHYTRLTPEVYTTWVDDMFMGLPYLMLAARLTMDQELKKQLYDDAAAQVISFNREVWNADAQLYQHAQYSEKKVTMPHWSRANGWGIWAVTEVLMELPKGHPLYKPILEHYRTHVNSLLRHQAGDGFWHNVLDVQESVKETSGTAIFTMALARGINQGWLKGNKYREAAMKGWQALETQIEANGTVRNICMGTMCSEDLNYYLTRPIVDDDSHGMLGLIMAAIEVQKMMDKN